ncbi:MAG: efflux RND transporter periplasmic adaptor subunit [bacterium]
MKSKMSQKPDRTSDQQSDMEENLGLDQASLGRRRRRKAGLLILAVLIAASIIIVSLRRDADKANSMQYKTQEAQRGDLTVTVTATGTLEPTNQVDVGSELSGIVKSVEADYNDRVTAGQVLARLDTEKLNARVTQSRAALESARAKVLQARATVAEALSRLDRLKQLYQLSNHKVPSQNDLDAAEAAVKRGQADEASARALVAEARAELEAYQTDLSKAVIRSPINGLVLKRSVEPGQTVAASLQAPVLFVLAEDLTQMELHVDVDEADVGQVTEGQEATFTVDAFPDRRFPAHITEVRYGAQTVNGVVTYETVLKVNNQDLLLRPGMTATADIIVREVKNALLVPNAALRFDPEAEEDEKPQQSRNLVTMLLPRPPGRRPASAMQRQQKKAAANSHQRKVWILREGKPAAIPLTIGLTDGQMTEVKAGDVQPGLPLLVDMVRPGQ